MIYHDYKYIIDYYILVMIFTYEISGLLPAIRVVYRVHRSDFHFIKSSMMIEYCSSKLIIIIYYHFLLTCK